MSRGGWGLGALASIILFLLLGSLAAASATLRPATAGPGVHVIKSPLAMPGLERTRTIRVYLPPGYAEGSKRYRVLYMHDGQNLFDDATSYVGEWGVDEAMDALARSDGIELIVVGIDHGNDKRLSELRPYAHPRFGPAEGDQYLDFVVHVVKPFIDKTYRTRAGRKDTGILGSSLGGLMSHYALLKYPKVFSRVGIFSPSYWIAEAIYPATEAIKLPRDTRIFMVVGDDEGEEEGDRAKTVDHVKQMATLLQRSQGKRITLSTTVRAGAKHNEAAWKREFPDAIRFLFGR